MFDRYNAETALSYRGQTRVMTERWNVDSGLGGGFCHFGSYRNVYSDNIAVVIVVKLDLHRRRRLHTARSLPGAA
jgi:hypothetical protein